MFSQRWSHHYRQNEDVIPSEQEICVYFDTPSTDTNTQTETSAELSTKASNQIYSQTVEAEFNIISNKENIETPQLTKKRIRRPKKQIEEGISLDDLKRKRLF